MFFRGMIRLLVFLAGVAGVAATGVGGATISVFNIPFGRASV